MPSPKDLEVKVYLNEKVYNDFIRLAEMKGMSQSGFARSLIIQALVSSRAEVYQHELTYKND